jgi:hypothetical protein
LRDGIPAPPPLDPNRAPSGTTRSIFDPEFNAFNHAQFAAPGNTIGNANAGVISSLLFGATARQIQVAMKLSF